MSVCVETPAADRPTTMLIPHYLVRGSWWQLLPFGHCLAAADEIVDEPLLGPSRLGILVLGWRSGS